MFVFIVVRGRCQGRPVIFARVFLLAFFTHKSIFAPLMLLANLAFVDAWYTSFRPKPKR